MIRRLAGLLAIAPLLAACGATERLLGGPDDFEIGMEVVLDLETLRTDDDGNDIVIFRFSPADRAEGVAS